MSTTPHIEKHSTSTDMVRDIVIGMLDGLTVPFALAAEISGVGAATNIVVKPGWPRSLLVPLRWDWAATWQPVQTRLIG